MPYNTGQICSMMLLQTILHYLFTGSYVWTNYAGLLPIKVGFIISNEFIVYSLCFISNTISLLLLGVTLHAYNCISFIGF